MRSSRAFFVLWGAQAVGSLGAGAAGFALSLTVFSMTGNTLYLSLITALSTFAQIFLAPLAGGLSDYVSAKVAAVAANLGLATTSVAIGMCILIGAGQTIWFILILVFVNGFASTLLAVSLISSVRRLRSEPNLTRANGVTAMLERGPVLVAPILGSVLYATAKPESVFFVAALTAALCAVVASRFSWGAARSKSRGPLRPFAGALAGVLYITRTPTMFRLQVSFAFINLCNGIGVAALIAYVVLVARLNRVPEEFGLAAANVAGGLGLVVGATLVTVSGNKWNRVLAIGGGVVAGALVGRALLAISVILVVVVISMFVRNLMVEVQNAPLTALWQEVVPIEVQGAVFGARRLIGQGLYPAAVVAGGAVSVLLQGSLGLESALRAVLLTAAILEALVGVYLLIGSPIKKMIPERG